MRDAARREKRGESQDQKAGRTHTANPGGFVKYQPD
jgi:hypothetical protein